MTAEKKQNKSYYVTLKSIVTDEVFPLLFDQGWERTPFANGAFGTFSQGWIWTLYKFDGTAAQSLTLYLTRHWSGYDAHPNLQIEYRLGQLPDGVTEPVTATDGDLMLPQPDCISVEHRRRPLGLCFDRRYGFKGTTKKAILERRVARCRQELITRFSDISDLEREWRSTRDVQYWKIGSTAPVV